MSNNKLVSLPEEIGLLKNLMDLVSAQLSLMELQQFCLICCSFCKVFHLLFHVSGECAVVTDAVITVLLNL